MGKTVLIVSDDEQIVRVVARIIGRSGHSLVLAYSYDEAADRLRHGARGIDAMITDLELGPGRSGARLAGEAKKFNMWIRVILFTGYALPDIYERFRRDGVDRGLLHKIVYKGASDASRELRDAVDFPDGPR